MASSLWSARFFRQAQLGAGAVPRAAAAAAARMGDDGGGFWDNPLVELATFGGAFIGLAIVCDDHMVVALETLCVRWNVRTSQRHPVLSFSLLWVYLQLCSSSSAPAACAGRQHAARLKFTSLTARGLSLLTAAGPRGRRRGVILGDRLRRAGDCHQRHRRLQVAQGQRRRPGD